MWFVVWNPLHDIILDNIFDDDAKFVYCDYFAGV